MEHTPNRYSVEDLSLMTGLTKRTIRYYIQIGLVDHPEGARRGAFYTNRHLDQLLTASGLQRSGLTLDGVRQRLDAADAPQRPTDGSVEVWSRVTLRNGIELHIEPHRAGLRPEQVHALSRMVISALETVAGDSDEVAMVADKRAGNKGGRK